MQLTEQGPSGLEHPKAVGILNGFGFLKCCEERQNHLGELPEKLPEWFVHACEELEQMNNGEAEPTS
jgi:hypothetical protein